MIERDGTAEPATEPGAAGTGDLARWQRIKALFVDVVEHARTAREAALRELAANDPGAAEEARRLLRHYDEATTSFLSRTRFPVTSPDEVPSLEGRVVGGYRVGAPLGHGGMGRVYAAVREEDGKRVAVKLLRFRGDPEAVAAEVREERRILAALEHDNIARLIDGGVTEDGLPYFTLERIDGRAITESCIERGLGVAARLWLFRTVCLAVEYAHQRLVVHCDIKPANILVTADGVPKLLDFGIARRLQPSEGPGAGVAGLPTALTPEYASPEQVRRQPVTTATDVYALGLLLFELLTGRRAQPLSTLDPREIERVVCENEPPPPSLAAPPELRRRLQGDLDAIVAKALRKVPAERYGSARELAEDVRRHLRSLPVEARGGGAGYRAARFLRRHRAAIAAGTLIAASLLGGTVAALREGRRAQRRFEDVRHLAGSFLFEFHDAIRDLPGSTPARQLIVSKALEYLDRLAGEAGDDLGLARELAAAYQRVGDVQGYPANPNLGDLAGAMASYRKAIALAERLVADAPEADHRFTLGGALERLGTIEIAVGETTRARETLGRAREVLEAVLRSRPADVDAAHGLHVVHIRLGQIHQARGEVDAALAAYEAAQWVDEAILAIVPDSRLARRDLSVALSLVAQVWGHRDPARGLELYQALLPPAIELAASDPTNAEHQRDLMVGYEDVAQMQGKLGRWPEALEGQRKALAIAEALLRADPSNLQALQDLSIRHAQIGDVLLEMGDLPAARDSYQRSLDLDAEVAAREPENAKAGEYLAWSHLNVAGVLLRLDQRAAALEHFRRAIAAATPFADRDPSNVDLRLALADANAGVGETLLAEAGSCTEAVKAPLARAVALWDAVGLETGPDLDHRNAVAARLAECGRR